MQSYEEFLELRQRLKESIRKKMQNGNDADPTPTSEQRKRKLPYNNFGSFFGHSQPVIAPRVLQESKPLLEKERLASKSIPTEVKKEAEKRKESRDYSFLLSDDAELPVSLKEPPSSAVSSVIQMQPKPCSSTNSSKVKPVLARKPASVPVDRRTKPLTSDPKPKQRVEQRKVSNEVARSPQMVPRKSLPPSKQRVMSKPELKRDSQLMKKKRRRMSEEDDLALKMVREICKSDRYAGRDYDDYDDRNMEASFEDIAKEEKRSARLAKKEDAEQLRLIEEEKRQERLAIEKKKKKLKLSD
ncbi:unnamed protein product [Microthlaspi erraticum]|uniref:Protein SPT2 homolog n=1 Tax=Microthlaspi erraticum TaxID=1685480 RepID=A0A6D2JG83_9BRAS|nr:unnamed protein product [Microthlaspi erraticum]